MNLKDLEIIYTQRIGYGRVEEIVNKKDFEVIEESKSEHDFEYYFDYLKIKVTKRLADLYDVIDEIENNIKDHILIVRNNKESWLIYQQFMDGVNKISHK